MKTKRTFLEVVNRLLPVLHERYREMCSLAAVGQLGGPQMSELNEHIGGCGPCREFLESVAQASVQVLPVLAEDRISAADIVPPAGMRSRFLARLGEESRRVEVTGNRFQGRSKTETEKERNYGEEKSFDPEGELVFQRLDPREIGNKPGDRLRGIGDSKGRSRGAEQKEKTGTRQYVWVAAIAACAVIGLSGFYLGRKTPAPRSAQIPMTALTPAAISKEANVPGNSVAVLERDKNSLQTELAKLQSKLAEAKADQDSLRNEIVVANEKLVSVQRNQAASQDTSREIQESKSEVAQLESETERLRQRLAESDTKLALQQQRTQEVSEKLQVTEANLRQELNLKDAKSQMGELVAARNLHIVDVYDADPEGKRQRAFGRVFYTEGKSLVFYAYDLEGAGQMKANVVFHVWGGKAGVKEVTHSLGILRKDDAGQARWAMTFDDPNVLSQINSVFVTAEASNKHYDSPRGKKVLYAYFGSAPNHP